MNYLDIFPDDVIIKIFDKRCDDIEEEIDRLENNNEYFIQLFDDLSITKKTDDELDELDDREENTLNYNDKYNIEYGEYTYCCDIFLFDTICIGEVIFVLHLCDYINDPDDYNVIESDITTNPTMFDLIYFTSSNYIIENRHPYIEGFNILGEGSYESYDIIPEEGVVYIELITGS
jgi:hypothetical protein